MKKSLILAGMMSIGIAYAQEYDERVGVNTQTPSATLNVKTKNNTKTPKNLELENQSGTKLVTVLNNGRVGINTEEPQDRLHIVNGAARVENGGSTGGYINIVNTDKPIGTNDVMSMWTIYNMTGSYGNSLQFWGYRDRVGTGAAALQNVLVLQDTGNIGIGIRDPKEKLDVQGNARFRTLPNVGGGTTDKVVVVDNTGVLKSVDRSSIIVPATSATPAVEIGSTESMKCDATNRGKMNFVKDVALANGKTADAFAVCLKGSDGNHYWRYLYGAGGETTNTGTFGNGLQ